MRCKTNLCRSGRIPCPTPETCDDFADTEPFPPPGSEGQGIVLATLVGGIILVVMGVMYAYF